MKISYLMIPMLALALLAGCKQNTQDPQEPAFSEEMFVEEDTTAAVTPVERVPVLQKAKPVQQKAVTPAPAPKKQEPALKGTIYVETDGAQGRVWGHVTMNGDRGTGTIHDWDENTWAVNVTRHGDELFAVDQNSRLYVFKLKQNKTQE